MGSWIPLKDLKQRDAPWTASRRGVTKSGNISKPSTSNGERRPKKSLLESSNDTRSRVVAEIRVMRESGKSLCSQIEGAKEELSPSMEQRDTLKKEQE